MSDASSALRIGANLAITCSILSIMLFVASLAVMVIYRVNGMNLQAVYKNVNSYASVENTLVPGDRVQYFVDSYSDKIFIRIATDRKPSGYFGDDLKDCRNVTTDSYVNPACKYFCTLLYDHNGDVVGANFEQDGLDLTVQELDSAIKEWENKTEEGANDGI